MSCVCCAFLSSQYGITYCPGGTSDLRSAVASSSSFGSLRESLLCDLKAMCTRLLAMNTPTADTSNGSHRYVMEIMVRPPRMTHRVWHARFRCPRGRSDAAASAAGQRYSLLPSPL